MDSRRDSLRCRRTTTASCSQTVILLIKSDTFAVQHSLVHFEFTPCAGGNSLAGDRPVGQHHAFRIRECARNQMKRGQRYDGVTQAARGDKQELAKPIDPLFIEGLAGISLPSNTCSAVCSHV